MARPFLSSSSSRSFSPLQQYFSLAARSHSHTHPRAYTSPPRPPPHCILGTRHYASSSSSSSTTTDHQPSRPPPSNPPRPNSNPPRPSELTQDADTPLPGSQESSPPPRTHYDLFPKTLPAGPPPAGPFAVPLQPLHSEYLLLQAKAHPDAHPHASKLKHEGISAAISEAYRTLKDPLLRAQYLLSLRGVDVANDETMEVGDPGLLVAVIEAREAIEGAESREEIRECWGRNERRISECVRALEGAFGGGDLEAARLAAVRMRYWVNIRDNLDVENWEGGRRLSDVH